MADRDPTVGRFHGIATTASEPRTVAATRFGGLAQQILADRQAIGDFFDPSLFVNPALDIVLTLFAAAEEGRRISVSGCCMAAGVPRTTALRWIGALHARELVKEEPDPLDRRRRWIMLTDPARAAVLAYLERIGT